MCNGIEAAFATPAENKGILGSAPPTTAGTVAGPVGQEVAAPVVPDQDPATPVDGSDKQLYCYSSSGTVSVTRGEGSGTLQKAYFDVAPWIDDTERKAGLTLETVPSGHLKLTSTRTGEEIFLQPGDLAALDNFVHVSREFVDGQQRDLSETQLGA